MCSPTPCPARGGPRVTPHARPPPARAAAPCRRCVPDLARHRVVVLAEVQPRRVPRAGAWPRRTPLAEAFPQSIPRPHIPLPSLLCEACPSHACRGPSPSCHGSLLRSALCLGNFTNWLRHLLAPCLIHRHVATHPFSQHASPICSEPTFASYNTAHLPVLVVVHLES